jgi:hypothetical protein
MKKSCVLGLMLVVGLAPLAAFANRGEYSLIVAPARYSVMQVLFDVIEQRPSVLVSYQGEASTANPALHVWNGATWNPIGVHDLQELSFLQRTPTRAVMVGDDSLLPVSVRDSLAWLPEVIYIRDLQTSALLNDFGRVFNWSSREWRWFAKRYNLELEDEAEPARRTSWYEQRGPRPRDAEGQRPVSVAPVGVQYTTQPVEPAFVPPPPIQRPSDLPVAPAPAAPRGEIDELIETQEVERHRAVEAPNAPVK